MRSIDIDFDIHQAIELERRGFEEEPYLALRRLLGFREEESAKSTDVVLAPKDGDKEARRPRRFIEKGIEFPDGTKARMEYQRGQQRYEGTFQQGALVVYGKSYGSLSAAASDLGKTKRGEKTSLNGWLYWKVQFPGENRWHDVSKLRAAR